MAGSHIMAAPSNGVEFDEARNNKSLSIAEVKKIGKRAGFFMFNLGFVYFLEYMCLTSFAERIVTKLNKVHPENADKYLYKHGYVVFTFCYQTGVFISRSSLSIIKIRRVEIMTILQGINFLFFLLNTTFLFLENFYVMFVLMVWVGLMGGSSYVNIMYNILESDKLAKNEKELALTITGVCNDVGILAASLLSLLLANTAFKIE